MAAMSGKTAGKSGGGAALALPPGFSLTPSPGYAEAFRHACATLPRKGGVVRTLLVATKTTTDEAIRELYGSPRFSLKRKAPSVYEVILRWDDMPSHLERHVGPDGMFRWVDMGSRFFGMPVAGADDLATVALRWEGSSADLKLKLKQLGGTIVEQGEAPSPAAATGPEPDAMADLAEEVEVVAPDPDSGLTFATLPGGKLAELALATHASSIEVRSVVVKAGTKK